MNNRLTATERDHLGRIKEMPCSVCAEPGPSDAHHIEQHRQFTAIPLCKDCHQGSFNGIHGQKRAWLVRKVTEMDALDATIRKMLTT